MSYLVVLLLLVPLAFGLPSGREYAKKHPNNNPGNNSPSGVFWQGDIKLKNPKDIELQKPSPLNAIWDKSLRWTNNIVYYSIQTEDFTQTQLDRIYEGIARLQNLVSIDGQNCITFVETNDEENYVDIFKEEGCWSAYGMVGGAQDMAFGNGCFSLGLIMHTLLHALGFYHEQGREDRDDYITIIWENIIPGRETNFQQFIEGVEIDHLGVPYDYDSVVHYSAYEHADDPSLPTIIPVDPDAEIGVTNDLSAIDIEKVQILYECLNPRDSKYFKSLAKKVL